MLVAIGLSSDAARESVRISLSEENTLEELDVLVEALKEIVPRVREMA